MSIQITENLVAVPQQVVLPASVTLRQKLISDQTAEGIVVEYSMAPDHEIWFQLADGTRSKSVTFTDNVAGTGSSIAHDARLVRHVGSPVDSSVGIEERITSSDGDQTLDVTFVLV
jgi:hypothetical protein